LYIFLLAPELFSSGNYRAGRGLLYQIKLEDVGGRLVKARPIPAVEQKRERKNPRPKIAEISKPVRGLERLGIIIREAHKVDLNSRLFAI